MRAVEPRRSSPDAQRRARMGCLINRPLARRERSGRCEVMVQEWCRCGVQAASRGMRRRALLSCDSPVCHYPVGPRLLAPRAVQGPPCASSPSCTARQPSAALAPRDATKTPPTTPAPREHRPHTRPRQPHRTARSAARAHTRLANTSGWRPARLQQTRPKPGARSIQQADARSGRTESRRAAGIWHLIANASASTTPAPAPPSARARECS